jgi:hypothetical protein
MEALESMPNLTPSQILEKFRLNFPMIQEESDELPRYKQNIS